MKKNTDIIEKMCPEIDFSDIPDDLLEAIPTDKLDITAAEKAIKLGHPKVEKILPILVAWLQDLNWPVAQTLEPFISRIGEPLKPVVQDVLKTNDDVWKYWVLTCLVTKNLTLAKSIEKELTDLRDSDKKSTEGLEEIADNILKDLDSK